MRFLKNRFFTLLTVMLCMSIFCIPAYASDGGETLTVTAAWVDGELLRINVTDANGESSALALRLSDYISDVENKEYISIQAVDLKGNKSGIIEIKNPYYVPSVAPVLITPSATEPQESAIPNGSKPFTPDGAGSVTDNAHESDGKEFFTVGTESGEVFYLIVDRQKNADNVYLLNAVTEEDLMALAAKNGREITTSDNNGTSAITMPEKPNITEEQSTTATTSVPELPVEPPKKNDTGMYIIIGIIVLAVGGAGYYFKIVKGRKNNAYDEQNDDDDDIYGYDNRTEDDDDDILEDGGDEG